MSYETKKLKSAPKSIKPRVNKSYNKQDIDMLKQMVLDPENIGFNPGNYALKGPEKLPWSVFVKNMTEPQYTRQEVEAEFGWFKRALESGDFRLAYTDGRDKNAMDKWESWGFSHAYHIELGSAPEEFFLLSKVQIPGLGSKKISRSFIRQMR